MCGGRGSGKTRTGAETLRDWIVASPPGDWGIVAPTDMAARKVCMEGRHSGLIAAFGGVLSPLIADYKRTDATLTLWNGSRVLIDGADDGAYRIQGENLSGAWCDEIGLWREWDVAWNESLRLAVRMDEGRIVATGTPKMGHGLVKQLLDDPQVPITHMRLKDNVANLPEDLVDEFYAKYGTSRRGRQELEGEFLEDTPGAIWSLELIDRCRIDALPEFDRVVIGVDPSGAADQDTGSNSIGIVVVGFSTHTQHGYVIADHTVRGGPDTWAGKVCAAYQQYGANMVVVERNFGGEMVRSTLRTANPHLPIKLVNASQGKAARAEPVVLLYEQGLVHHWRGANLAALEDQMVSWVPPRPGVRTKDSPDRLDALVWALTELMVGPSGISVTAYRSDPDSLVVRRGDLVFVGADAERFRDKPSRV